MPHISPRKPCSDEPDLVDSASELDNSFGLVCLDFYQAEGANRRVRKSSFDNTVHAETHAKPTESRDQVLIEKLVPKQNLGGSIPCRGPRRAAGPEKVRFGATRLPAAVRGGCLVSGRARLRR